MKLKLFFMMLAMGMLSLSIQSCDDDDDDNNAPEKWENAFVQKFGNETHSWSTRGANYVATFNQDNKEKEAWFDANGEWLMTETDITYESLPTAVKTAFEALETYKGWTRDDVDMLERKGMETVYVIEVEKGKEEMDLYFDAKGNLLKEIADKEDNSEDYLPSALPESVLKVLQDKYNGYKLLDADVDPVSHLLEVDVLLQNTQLEVCFDPAAKYAWVSTSQDVLFTSLPAPVKKAAEKAESENKGFELDDEAEKVTTPAGIYYIVELEMDGKPDIQVKINEDGTVKK